MKENKIQTSLEQRDCSPLLLRMYLPWACLLSPSSIPSADRKWFTFYMAWIEKWFDGMTMALSVREDPRL